MISKRLVSKSMFGRVLQSMVILVVCLVFGVKAEAQNGGSRIGNYEAFSADFEIMVPHKDYVQVKDQKIIDPATKTVLFTIDQVDLAAIPAPEKSQLIRSSLGQAKGFELHLPKDRVEHGEYYLICSEKDPTHCTRLLPGPKGSYKAGYVLGAFVDKAQADAEKMQNAEKQKNTEKPPIKRK